MTATAKINATNAPAAIPETKPRYGLLDSYVTTAAVNAPASNKPSRAILITPARSENKPPSAANKSGVASRIVEKSRISRNVNKSSILPPRVPLQRRDEKDDDRLQHLDQVLRDE